MMATNLRSAVLRSPIFQRCSPAIPIIPRKFEREQAFLTVVRRPRERVRDSAFEEVTVCDGDKVTVQGMVALAVDPNAGERGFRDAPIEYQLVPVHRPSADDRIGAMICIQGKVTSGS
jgi:hypothetical protein